MTAAITAFISAMANSATRVVLTTTSVVLFWLFISWSVGLMPAFGSGFASADDVTAIRVSLYETEIIERRIQYCEAPRGTAAKGFFLKSVNQVVTKLYDLTGIVYQLPMCEELVFESD